MEAGSTAGGGGPRAAALGTAAAAGTAAGPSLIVHKEDLACATGKSRDFRAAHRPYAQSARRNKPAPTFCFAEEASRALYQAARSNDQATLAKILGADNEFVSARDQAEERAPSASGFARKYDEMHRLVGEPTAPCAPCRRGEIAVSRSAGAENATGISTPQAGKEGSCWPRSAKMSLPRRKRSRAGDR